MNHVNYRNIKFFDKRKYIKINLQLFTGEKTEKATSKKRKESRKKGQVLQSKDIGSVMVLLAIFILIKVLGGYIYGNISDFTKNMILHQLNREELFTVGTIVDLSFESILMFLKETRLESSFLISFSIEMKFVFHSVLIILVSL